MLCTLWAKVARAAVRALRSGAVSAGRVGMLALLRMVMEGLVMVAVGVVPPAYTVTLLAEVMEPWTVPPASIAAIWPQ